MTKKENLNKSCMVCPLLDPVMIIQASMTTLKMSLSLDENVQHKFEKIEKAVDKIYEYILEQKETNESK